MIVEAMKQALEALDSDDPSIQLRAAVALRQAIAEAEKHDPVAWMDSDGFPWSKQGVDCRTTKDTYTPLYAALPKREWHGLGINQRIRLADRFHISIDAVEAIEAKLKERNT